MSDFFYTPGEKKRPNESPQEIGDPIVEGRIPAWYETLMDLVDRTVESCSENHQAGRHDRGFLPASPTPPQPHGKGKHRVRNKMCKLIHPRGSEIR